MGSKQQTSIQDLLEKIMLYLPPHDVETIKSAYAFAKKAHDGQFRKSGDAYITHPLEVASILADLKQDATTLCAGLLHDVLEDTPYSETHIKNLFGKEVCDLVLGVTKLGKIHFDSMEDAQADNFRKMFVAMAKDIRVVIIKLADRIHNMRTLKFKPKDRQQAIARETRDIFAPLAHRLGMWSLKWELEDLAFYYLQYEDFQDIKRLISSKREEREQLVENFIDKLTVLLDRVHIKTKIRGRPKHFYSIYKKLLSQDIAFDELYDALGVRIMVGNLKECYEVLGVVHASFKPINGRFKDYIAMPKSHMYQSLHTTVIGPQGQPVEVQIRTAEMDQIAEYGVAAHWKYKEGEQTRHFDADFSWLRQILENQKEQTPSHDFLQALKVDLFIDEVFVFTPKGAVQILPKGATPVDFAYKIHTEIGHCCVGAKINNHIVPLHHVLQSGDRVEILTSKKQNPKLDWIQFVVTGQAKTKIKQWIKKQQIEEPIPSLSPLRTELTPPPRSSSRSPYNPPASSEEGLSDIRIVGENHVLSKLAHCCHPIPGDSIIGFVTVGRGVSVHRQDCLHILHLKKQAHSRMIQAEWAVHNDSKHVYITTLIVKAFDRIGILKDILNSISTTKTNIREVSTKTVQQEDHMRAHITLETKSLKTLALIEKSIRSIEDVFSVSRL